MSDRPAVLVLADDARPGSARTARHLCSAMAELGHQVIGRDTSLVRWAAAAVEDAARLEAYEKAVAAKWNTLLQDYGVERVMSIDLDWLFTGRLFLDAERVRRIDSIWQGDVASRFLAAEALPMVAKPIRESIAVGKVLHHAAGPTGAAELRAPGLENVRVSRPGAPAELLEHAEPCDRPDRLAFFGEPDPWPSARGRSALERREGTDALRRLARDEMIETLEAAPPAWLRERPEVRGLLLAAAEIRLAEPDLPSVTAFARVGRTVPDVHEFLVRDGAWAEILVRLKSIDRYTLAGRVRRLWQRGGLDVYGARDVWAVLGVEALPSVPWSRFGATVRRYPAVLHLPQPDLALAPELFEIAACGRVVLTLDQAEIHACYEDGEIFLAATDDALEASAAKILRDPSAALVAGENGRRRTARAHLWRHRLEGTFS